jgi:hypothetical protein
MTTLFTCITVSDKDVVASRTATESKWDVYESK